MRGNIRELHIEKQSGTKQIHGRIKVLEQIEIKRDEIPVDATSELGCFRIIPPSQSATTLFYIPGTASSLYFPDVEKAIGSHLANELNCRVIVIFPRISRENKFPIPLNDISRVISYYLNHCEHYGINHEKIALGGYSSGGLLAIQLCMISLERQVMPFRQLLLLAPVTDLAHNPVTENHQDAQFLTREFFENMVREYVPQNMSPYSPSFSPIESSADKFQGLPPTIFVYGTLECFAPSINKLYDLFIQQKVSVERIIIEGETHDFPWKGSDYLSLVTPHFLANFQIASPCYHLPIQLPIIEPLKDTYYCPHTRLIMRNPVVTEEIEICEEESLATISHYPYISARGIEEKINEILRRHPELIMENRVYLPKKLLMRFREAVYEKNIEEIAKLLQMDIRLLIYDPKELTTKRVTFWNEETQPDDYTGFQFICEKGSPELLAVLMAWIQSNLYGRYNIIQNILSHRMPENYNPHILNLSLTKSVIEGQYNFCQALLAWGAEIKTTLCTTELGGYFHNDGRRPLHWAVAKNHFDIAGLLLHSGANHDAINAHGWKPIHMLNSVPMLRLLREYNVDIKAVIPAHNIQYGGWTALHAVAHGGHLEVAKALLACAPELVKQTSGGGDTPLHVVKKKPGPKFEAMVSLLAKHGANIRAVNRHGFFALGTSVPKGDAQDVQAVDDKIADELLGEQSASTTRKVGKYKQRIVMLETKLKLLKEQVKLLNELTDRQANLQSTLTI